MSRLATPLPVSASRDLGPVLGQVLSRLPPQPSQPGVSRPDPQPLPRRSGTPSVAARMQRCLDTPGTAPLALPPVWALHEVGVGDLTLSFSAFAGQIVHLRGGSPLARLRMLTMAAGFAPAASGSCEVLGRDTRSLDDETRRQLRQHHIAWLLAGDHLPDVATAQACVALPLLRQGVPAPQALARARRELDVLCAGGLANCAPHRLSPAQVRLVLLARSMVTRPLLLVLEHPEDHLPPPALAAVRQSLWALAHDAGTCVVMTTDHAPLMASADHVLDLDLDLTPGHGAAAKPAEQRHQHA